MSLLAPLGLYAAWTAATWVLEGRIRTLLRSEAALRASGTLDALAVPRVPLLAMGAFGLAVLVVADMAWTGRRSETAAERPRA